MMRSVARPRALLAVVLLAGCMSVPTLPVPPPVDMSKVSALSAPSENGIVCVSGNREAVPGWSEVYRIRVRVTNLDTLEYREEDVFEDGSFEVCVFAESGHRLAVQAVYPYGGVSEARNLDVP